jgi:hypothetical protein
MRLPQHDDRVGSNFSARFDPYLSTAPKSHPATGREAAVVLAAFFVLPVVEGVFEE